MSLGITDIAEKIREIKLKWFKHVWRGNNDKIVNKTSKIKVQKNQKINNLKINKKRLLENN